MVVFVLADIAGEARAQYDDDPDPSHEPTTAPPPPTGNPWQTPREKSDDRSGLAFGVQLGYGIAGGMGETNDALAAGMRLGWKFRKSRALLAAEFWIAIPRTSQAQSEHFIHVGLGGLAQFWLTPRFWLGPGAGAACAAARNAEECTDNAFSLRALAGYELVHAPHFALDTHLQLGAEIFDNDGAAYALLMLGFTWFDI